LVQPLLDLHASPDCPKYLLDTRGRHAEGSDMRLLGKHFAYKGRKCGRYDKDEVPEMQPIMINPVGVASLLSGPRPFKAAGPDDIPAYLLKETANKLAASLAEVFKASLYQSKLPPDWKTAHIVPTHKKGDRSLPNNYKPISLTSLCCKTLEHIIIITTYTCSFHKPKFFPTHNMVLGREEVMKVNWL